MEKVMLNNGVTMPVLGFGVFQIPDAKECERCVLDAIEVGYRSIDTAQIYGNEEAVGRAAEKSGVPREELFLTTKVWISNGGYEKAKASIDESLRKLRTDYLDLLLIHQPYNDYYGAWRALGEMQDEGLARSIGVDAPIRESGDIAGSGACKIIGSKGEIEISEGVIVAKRHIHLTPACLLYTSDAADEL
mgnify:CR=1 FL=1